MDVVEIILLIALWVIPISFIIFNYRKLDDEEKEALKIELKDPLFYLVEGCRYLGMLILFTGTGTSIPLLIHIGIGMMATSWITAAIMMWKVSQKRSVLLNNFAYGYFGLFLYSNSKEGRNVI
ncbi:hypothetical protein NC661_15095 [Aquibacillus koreensis]|uniref:Uncharacterized protein n=1 Tax=Aquibacillus koreensis TaxID=279446 RepID=A0A9X3WN70_9BACI|nr:hypothetical protein [Aquibacillus koreensis]MCT2534391.1 hypothetical protein [Aquibacillus koreensis]MDC3421698.1 hypothetical protein [Aquibacillus koreensis]